MVSEITFTFSTYPDQIETDGDLVSLTFYKNDIGSWILKDTTMANYFVELECLYNGINSCYKILKDLEDLENI